MLSIIVYSCVRAEGLTMTAERRWKTGGVRVVRADAQESATRGLAGRATVFDFAGSGGCKTWIGTVTLQPEQKTVPHHHGRHEVAVYVVKGRSEIRWGERLEFFTEVGPGDFAYFAPFVPHQEINPDASEPVDFLVVRSDGEKIAVALTLSVVAEPEKVF